MTCCCQLKRQAYSSVTSCIVQIKQENYWNLSLTSQQVCLSKQLQSKEKLPIDQFCKAEHQRHPFFKSNILLADNRTQTLYSKFHSVSNSQIECEWPFTVVSWWFSLWLGGDLPQQDKDIHRGQMHQPIWPRVHWRAQALSQVLSALRRKALEGFVLWAHHQDKDKAQHLKVEAVNSCSPTRSTKEPWRYTQKASCLF